MATKTQTLGCLLLSIGFWSLAACDDAQQVREPAVHVPAPMVCSQERPASQPIEPTPQAQCTKDADCTAGRNGRCVSNRGVVICSYDTCFSSADCPGPQACGCRLGWEGSNRCLEGNCSSNADCGAGGYCSPTLGTCGNYSGIIGYYCRTPKDECLSDSDCTTPDTPHGGPGYCAFDPKLGHWACGYSHCVG